MAGNQSGDEVKKLMKQFREWIDLQPHLPKDVEDRILLRFLHSCYYDLEKTKTAFELFIDIRTASPELLSNRDPELPQMQKTLSIVNLAQIHISDNRKLWIWQLNDPGLEKFDYLQDVRLFFMCADAWLLDDDRLQEKDIVLMDVKDISLKFITKYNVSVARKLSKYQQEALPLRLKQIHVVNAAPFIDKVFALLKPFLKQEITDVVHFHTPKSETLFQYLQKEDVPKDFGGTLGSMEEHMKTTRDLLTRQRDLILNDKLWTAIDTKTKHKTNSTMSVGTFRSLDID